MNNEIGKQVYRKLLYFFENKLDVHIVLTDNSWHNGKIIDLSETKLIMVLDEFVEGKLPILLEKVIPDLIKEYRVRR